MSLINHSDGCGTKALRENAYFTFTIPINVIGVIVSNKIPLLFFMQTYISLTSWNFCLKTEEIPSEGQGHKEKDGGGMTEEDTGPRLQEGNKKTSALSLQQLNIWIYSFLINFKQ